MNIRPATRTDDDAIWAVLEPIIRAGETYALPREWKRDDVLAFWYLAGHDVFVATDDDKIVGTYFIGPNQKGGGAHVANCGYATATASQGKGVARTMCEHSLAYAREKGFRAMQYNLVVASNTRAIALWERMGFSIVGTLPGSFAHPKLGFVDAHVMYLNLAVDKRTWRDLDQSPRHSAMKLDKEVVPDEPGVYAWYRDGKRVYVGMGQSLRDRVVGNHLGKDPGLSGSAFRRNVAEQLGFGSPAAIKKKAVVLTAPQLDQIRSWIQACEVTWLTCETNAAAIALETKLKAEHMPHLTKK
jgi:ribosomal protein S18 acetylase RimI-like enzyme